MAEALLSVSSELGPSTGDGGGIDLVTILIIALVAVGAVGAFLFLRKRRSGSPDEYDQEGYPDEGFEEKY